MDSKRKVVEYYDYTIPFYKVFWHKGTNALHYGIWDEHTKTLPEALLNTNKVMADTARIQLGDMVLDAGCGVGGSALWLAKHRGAHVVGITISEKQKDKANTYAQRPGLQDKTEFFVRDFNNTGFADATFDVVWAIESVCHAERKADFLNEAFRILKPGGRIIVGDGFLRRTPGADREMRIYQEFCQGFALDNLATVDSFSLDMHRAGFMRIEMHDMTARIAKPRHICIDSASTGCGSIRRFDSFVSSRN